MENNISKFNSLSISQHSPIKDYFTGFKIINSQTLEDENNSNYRTNYSSKLSNFNLCMIMNKINKLSKDKNVTIR